MATQDYNFQDRMAAGKVNNDSRRALGLSAGKNAKGWNVKRPQSRRPDLDSLEAYYYTFKKDIHYNAYCAVEFELFGHEWEGL
jgi:hypothetical protein